MGLTIEELLQNSEAFKMKLICGEKGLKNQIKYVTIIEAPDIVRFISGGELLLTGLYAFRSCSVPEFKEYISELRKKEISGIVLKKGRHVDEAEAKIELLKEFAEGQGVPLIEVPFEVSFQKIMSQVMEPLFNEEISSLKYFKTTHDNFTALLFSNKRSQSPILEILDMLEKLVRNPVSIYNQNMTCYATTNEKYSTLSMLECAERYEPGILTNNRYMVKQQDDCRQYIVEIKMNIGIRMYLVITEVTSTFGKMDEIAVENAIVALQYEFTRQFAVTELEKKFQNDILNNILSGKIVSAGEMRKGTALLGMDMKGFYRVIVFGYSKTDYSQREINKKIQYINTLENVILQFYKRAKVHKELDKIVLIQEVDPQQTQMEYRSHMKKRMEEIQKTVNKYHKKLLVKAGAGKVVEGVVHIPESYKEAGDAFNFVEVASGVSEEGNSNMMLFSDLGIMKLLCQLEDTDTLLEYVPESLQKLYSYKQPQRDDLVLTLQSYLDYNQNLSKTAQDLFIHYKTAAYRIEKIAKITGMDFRNANEMLAVRIGLVVYKMIEKREEI